MFMGAWVIYKWLHLPFIYKQTVNCKSPLDWLVSLAMDFAALYDIWSLKWYQWTLLDCSFSVDIAFAQYLVAPHHSHPPLL